MYRRSAKYQRLIARLARAKARREALRPSPDKATPLQDLIPELRRVIEVTNYDGGQVTKHTFELYKSDRIDCFNVKVDGKCWKKRIGFSQVLSGLRKAIPRMRSLDD